MRLSRFFLPTSKEVPAEARIISHQLMLRAGMIRQSGAGIYSWLPLGYKVLKKIEQIVREEQNRAGVVEMLMPTIQPAELWRESGRYDDYGEEMLRITDRSGRDMLYGPTNEEMITEIFRTYIHSYRQLPLLLYHIQWKFRDELRPRFGVMRGREFLMKDAYSFDLDKEGAIASYRKIYCAYLNSFARLGLKAIPMRAETGPIGGDLSHEFVILAETGESEIHCHGDLLEIPAPGPDLDFDGDLGAEIERRSSLYAATDDMHDPERFAREVPPDKQISARGIEVGHIFYFADKYSQPMRALAVNAEGVEAPVHMGSYGIGVSRLVGAMIEAGHDAKGMIWPTGCAPFGTGLINLKPDDVAVTALCEQLYRQLGEHGADPLYDDTDKRAGIKLSIMELIGTPHVLVVGPQGLKRGTVELRTRQTGNVEEMSPEAAMNKLAKLVAP